MTTYRLEIAPDDEMHTGIAEQDLIAEGRGYPGQESDALDFLVGYVNSNGHGTLVERTGDRNARMSGIRLVLVSR